MLKLTAIGVLVWSALLAGCENPEAGVFSAQTSESASPETESSSAPAVPADPAPATSIVGCWAKATPGVVDTISINADQTCSDLVVADPVISAGRTILSSCTWAPNDSSTIAFAYPDGPQVCTYIIVGDALTLLCPYMHEPQTYQRATCL